MSVTEINKALGSWSLNLKPNTPQSVLDQLDYFGHVVITRTRDDAIITDATLPEARYVGVLRGRTFTADTKEIKGASMAFWLGDEDNKGAVYETPVAFTAASFTSTIAGLLPASGSVTAGTITSVSGTYTGNHLYQSPREAINYVCDTFGAEWRVTNDGKLDAGLATALYSNNPDVIISRHVSGLDMNRRSLSGDPSLAEDVEDFTTRVVLLAAGTGSSTATGAADIAVNPYKDIYGNTVKLTRLVSESETVAGNATARAQLQLNRFVGPRDAVTLSSEDYDIKGVLKAGAYVWVHDLDAGLVDTNNELMFRGQLINPILLRILQVAYPVDSGCGVYFRRSNGTYVPLTDFVEFETGQTSITVSGYDRSLSGSTSGEIVGARPLPNGSVPNTPAWVSRISSVYRSLTAGITKAALNLTWLRPLNTDGTAIIDGDYYEIRYRPSNVPAYPTTWAQIAGLTWGALGTWDALISYPLGQWEYIRVSFDQLTYVIQELTPGTPYELQIRAVDNGDPANYSPWSSSVTEQTTVDTIPPQTPATPVVASSLIAIQVTHNLGVQSGGTFNLDVDLNHLEVHGSYEPLFTPSTASLLGKLQANAGNITGQIPVVGTFPANSVNAVYIKVIAVDDAGNKSQPSLPASATATLISDQYVTSLTASKITAGTISSQVLLSGSIKTGETGSRVELNASGLQAYDAANIQTVDISAADGSVEIAGQLTSRNAERLLIVNPTGDIPAVRLYDNSVGGTSYAELGAFEYYDDFLEESFYGIELGCHKADGSPQGGSILPYQQGFIAQYYNAAGVPEGIFSLIEGLFSFQGLLDGGDYADQMITCFDVAVSAGVSSVNIIWAETPTTTRTPFISMKSTTVATATITAETATSITVGFSSTAAAKTLHVLALRVI